MATTVSTSATYANLTLTDLVDTWVYSFGTAAHGVGSTGGFNTSTLAGTQYASSSTTGYAFIAESDTGLTYNMTSHVVSGNLDNLDFGAGLTGSNIGTASGNYTLTNVTFSLNDLGWDTTTTNNALAQLLFVNSSSSTDVNEQLSSFLDGLEASFQSAIDTYNSTHTTQTDFDHITLAQLAEVGAADLSATGVAAATESDLALAA